jgi:ATP-dependent protease Clp ATPase subunit
MSKLGSSDCKDTLCSFCGKSQHEVRKLSAGPKNCICNECLGICIDVIREDERSSAGRPQSVEQETAALFCSFCDKSQHDVRQLIAGPAVFICNECVGCCGASLRDLQRDLAPRSRLIDRLRAWFGVRTDGTNSYLVGMLR